MNPKFELGQVVATPAIVDDVPRAEILNAIQRHESGDWGTVCEEDARANDMALKDGTRVLSVYDTSAGQKIFVITEADRSATTVLFPREY